MSKNPSKKYPLSKKVQNLPSLTRKVLKTPEAIEQTTQRLNELRTAHIDFHKNTQEYRDIIGYHLQEYKTELNRLEQKYSDLSRQLYLIENKLSKSKTSSDVSKPSSVERLADDHLLDGFYLELENRYRGPESEMKKRQTQYIKYLKGIKSKSKSPLKVLDIGCGRGEFLELLKENGFEPIGLDINDSMYKIVKDKGFEASDDDALEYLLKQDSSSLSAITGFQIVEHIPFDQLIRIMNECYRVLVDGGIAIFETPNPENIVVSTKTFYYDPSHLHPLPPDLLEFVMKNVGFKKNVILKLNPVENKTESKDPFIKELQHMVYGPRDYSVISYK